MSESVSRGLIKSMFIIGSAQIVNILISIVKMKVIALILGPSGLGLLSIYNTLLQMIQQTAGLGMKSSGVREIASSRGEEATLSRVRCVLLVAHLFQGVLAMLVVWLLRARIAVWLFGDALRATEVGLIGVAVLLTLLSAAHIALLQGMRRIANLGSVTVIGAFIGTLAGLVAIWMDGESGLVWFVLVQPLVSLLVALHYTCRLPELKAVRLTLAEYWATWKPMAKLGIAFMLGGLATVVTLLLVRGRISQELGLDAAGYFAAAWGITMTYVGFLLGAMGADYYPRLTEVIRNRRATVRLLNEQVQLGLAIGGPVLLLLIGLAPWVITLLYSTDFKPAVTLLQWQTVGNVFKLASWPLGFSIAALARGKTFLFVQVNFNILFLLMLWPTLPHIGIVAAGPAFSIAYFLHFCFLNSLVRRIHGFRWETLSLGLLSMHAVLAVILLALAQTAPVATGLISSVLAAATGLLGLRVVLVKIGTRGRLASTLARFYAIIGWPVQKTA